MDIPYPDPSFCPHWPWELDWSVGVFFVGIGFAVVKHWGEHRVHPVEFR